MRRFMGFGRIFFLGTMMASVGCGEQSGGISASADPQEVYHQNMLSEVGEILTIRKVGSKQPPKHAEDLASAQTGWPVGYKAVKDGEVTIAWGVPIVEGASDRILAYEKVAPESGGFVLMQDGKTVKKMTADDFKAAPMAVK